MEPAPEVLGRPVVLDGFGQQGEEVLVRPEVRDVPVGQVDSPRDGPGATQAPELVELSLAAGHDQRRLKGGYRSVTSVKA